MIESLHRQVRKAHFVNNTEAETLLPTLNRRRFLQGASSLSAVFFAPKGLQDQAFQAGIISVGKTTAANGRAEVWEHCDEIAQLGFHRFEVNNTRAAIAEYYADRTAEYKEQLELRHLDLVGLAQYSRAGERDGLASLLEQHRVIGRFLAAVGGKYITHMLAPGEILNESDESAYRDLDVKAWAKNLNEIGYRLHEDCGVKLGYHPLRAEVSGGLYKRLLEITNERYVFLIPDIGHLAAGGADPVEVCKTYRSRIVAVHLKDFSLNVSGDKKKKAGNVPFGEGIANLPGVVAELQRTRFNGWILGESGGTNQAMHDYMTGPLRMHL
jgi:sugar phosphate isomerase/epimerase